MGGSGGVIVMDDTHCVVKAAHRLLQFYAHESCGKCTPCRIGGDWAVRTYERILAGEGSQVELDTLIRVSDGLQNGRCLCGLGDFAPGPPRPQTACTTPVSEGMVVRTQSAMAVQARADILEFELANHPLDCPVCDKGGECPLQDFTFRHGYPTSRIDGPRLH